MSRSAAAYQKFTEDEIRKANSVDILSLARGYGYEPEKAGRKAVHMKHSGGPVSYTHLTLPTKLEV